MASNTSDALLPPSSDDKLDQQWEEMYRKLLEHKNKKGYCFDVPETVPLGQWLHRQRWLYRHGHLRDDRAKKLLAIGFEDKKVLKRGGVSSGGPKKRRKVDGEVETSTANDQEGLMMQELAVSEPHMEPNPAHVASAVDAVIQEAGDQGPPLLGPPELPVPDKAEYPPHIITLDPLFDVLDGKGRRASGGNKYYRSIMRLFKRDQDYIKNSGSIFKKRIADEIYKHIQCNGGVFRNQNNEVKSKEDSIKKITQSLRDYSRDDRHVYNNQNEVDGCFPEIRCIEEKVSRCKDVEKQYKVAIEELQNLTERISKTKELVQVSNDGSWSGQKRNYEETHTVIVEGQYIPYSRNPFYATITGYNIHQNLTRSKKTNYYEVPHRFQLSNPHIYETFDTFGNLSYDHGTPKELKGDCSGQFSPVEFSMREKEFSSYIFYKSFSMNSQAPDRHGVVAKRSRQGVMGSEDRDFVKQTCRKRTLVASLAYDFNEFLKKQMPSKTGFPLIVITPCRIYDRNVLVEKKMNKETWKVFSIEETDVQKKKDEDEEFMKKIDQLSPGDESSITFLESLDKDACLSIDEAEEGGEQCFDLNGQKISFKEIVYLFMAYAFMKTDHQVAIYKIEGSLNSNMSPDTFYELTDPSIHTSRNHYESFGDDDEGRKGIEKFAELIKPYEKLLQRHSHEKNIDALIPGVVEL